MTTTFVILALGVGGAERSALTTAEAWFQLDPGACTVVAARPGAYRDPDALRKVPTTIVAPTWPRPDGVARLVLGLRHHIRTAGTSTLVLNNLGMACTLLAAKAARILPPVRLVIVERTPLSVMLADRLPSRAARPARAFVLALMRWLYRRADTIIGVSNGVARDLEATLGREVGSISTIYNPVDTEAISTAIESAVPEPLEAAFRSLRRPIVVSAGRMVPVKAQRDLLDAFAMMQTGRGSLVILGDGPLRRDLERQAEELGVARRVWMPGFVDNPWWFIARSDLFALSSRREGFGRVLVEALACGVPVVSTDCPSGPREILDGVPNTRLSPVSDPSALAIAMEQLLTASDEPTGTLDFDRYRPASAAVRYRSVIHRLGHPDEEQDI